MRGSLAVVTFFLAALAAAPVFALGKIRVTSDAPAYVQMKGHKLGRTPLVLHDLKRGTYELTITSLWTGETRLFRVSIPLVRPVTRNVAVRFAPAPPATPVLVASEARVAAKYARQERVGSPMRMALGAPAKAPPAPPRAPAPAKPKSSLAAASERWTETAKSWASEAKKRTGDRYTSRHLVSGGVVLIGAAVGSGVLAGLGIGGALVNEVVHRDGDDKHSHATSRAWTPVQPR